MSIPYASANFHARKIMAEESLTINLKRPVVTGHTL